MSNDNILITVHRPIDSIDRRFTGPLAILEVQYDAAIPTPVVLVAQNGSIYSLKLTLVPHPKVDLRSYVFRDCHSEPGLRLNRGNSLLLLSTSVTPEL